MRTTVDAQLANFDLNSFANKKAGTLSGGNKRKLQGEEESDEGRRSDGTLWRGWSFEEGHDLLL